MGPHHGGLCTTRRFAIKDSFIQIKINNRRNIPPGSKPGQKEYSMQRDYLTRGILLLTAGLTAAALTCASANAQTHAEVIYLFDTINATNVVSDSTTNAQDGVVLNGATLSTDVPPIIGAGYAGNMSMEFLGDGGVVDPHVRIVDTSAGDNADDLDLALTDLTIEAWIKPTADRGMTLFQDAGVRNFNNKSIGLRYVQSGQIRFTLQIETGDQPVNIFTPPDSVPINDWTHVAARLDRGKTNATVHINGVLTSIVGASGVAGLELHDNAPAENMVQVVGAEFFGASINTVEGWVGLVDEFRLSSTALSDEHIRAAATTTMSTTLAGESAAQSTGDTVTLTFETESGDDYTLQTTSAPASNVWNDEPVTVHGTGDLVTFKTVGSAATTLYRLQKTL
jgi:hypothetical protein